MKKSELLEAIVDIAKETEKEIKGIESKTGKQVKNDVICSLKAMSHEKIVEEIKKYKRLKKKSAD